MAIPKSNHLSNAQIADYVDNLLAPAEKRKIERHLQSCAVCRAEVHAQRILRMRIHRQQVEHQGHIGLPKTGPLHP